MSVNINKPAFFALIVYPVILIFLLIHYILAYHIGWFEVILFLLGYYISNITVGVGLHRLWAHDTYKTNSAVELIFSLLSAGTLQGPALSWASNHIDHHTYTDTENDPHSPLKYKSKLLGFLWSHMGWMLLGEGSYRSINRIAMVKLGSNKILRWQFRYYWQIALIMNTVVPALVGITFGQTFFAAYTGYLFIGLGRSLQQQITFCVNSLCHFAGTQEYTKGTAGDIWWMALFLLGENWHNYHHAFPTDYRNGAKWYQFDVHKWIIYLMSKLGLAWDLKRTPKIRVEAKVLQTIQQYNILRQNRLKLLQNKVHDLVENLHLKFSELDSCTALKSKMLNSFSNAQSNLNMIKSQLNQRVKNLEGTSEKFLSSIAQKLDNIETSLQSLYLEFEKSKTFDK